jgi:hypothetical protein
MHDSQKPQRHRPDQWAQDREDRLIQRAMSMGLFVLKEGEVFVVFSRSGRELSRAYSPQGLSAWLTSWGADGGPADPG